MNQNSNTGFSLTVDPHNLRVSSSLEEADGLKLTDVQQTRFGDYEQGGDQDMII